MNLSPTSLGAWTQCERLYEALYVDRQKFLGVKLPAMRSTWVHKGISQILGGAFWRGVAHDMAVGFAADFRDSKLVDAFGEAIVHHRPASVMMHEQAALVEAAIMAWRRQRQGALEGWRVLQTERSTKLGLGASRFHDAVEFIIRPDWVLVNDATMTIRPFDVKLTSNIDQEWIDQWQVSPQAFWYQFALERLYPGYKVDPLWIEAIAIGRAGKVRHNSPLIYAWSAQLTPPFDPDLIWYENPPRRAQLFRAWSEADCREDDPLAKHIERLPAKLLEKSLISVEGRAPQMDAGAVEQMFADVVKIADQIEARSRERLFRWTGLMAGSCATPYNRCPMYRRCFRVDGWAEWYQTREAVQTV